MFFSNLHHLYREFGSSFLKCHNYLGQAYTIIEGDHEMKRFYNSYFLQLKLLFILNIVDGICTYIGRKFKIITEANLLMSNIIDQLDTLLLYKILLPSILIIGLYFLLKQSNRYNQSLVKLLCFFAVSIYTGTICLHSYWIGCCLFV